ncbi:MAG: L-idonate 5-dehydrogenase [Opitutales bacterium]
MTSAIHVPDSMSAALLHGASDVRIESMPTPDLQAGMVLLRIRRVGICGSDLHYHAHGQCGAFVPTGPFVMGHELSAEIAAKGAGVDSLELGQRVTVNPARSCGRCHDCKTGRPNLCRHIIMLGSASTTPPTNGAMAEFVAVRADQCHVLPAEVDDGVAAMLEPFAVALHAVKRAGAVAGKRVLVTGGGTIGLLTAIAARVYGAPLVVVSDVVESRLEKARSLGVDATLNPASASIDSDVSELAEDGFDLILEASGAPQALRQAFDLIRVGGTIVQIGTLGAEEIPLPANQVMVKEINFIGSMRYGDVFDEALQLVASGRVDLQPFITEVFPFTETAHAMAAAADKSTALKVQIEFA